MPMRIYIVPVVLNSRGVRVPKYFSDPAIVPSSSPRDQIDYGDQPWMIVGADLLPADDTEVAGMPDVNAVPFNLDTNPSAGAVNVVESFLEAANVPADWVNPSLTWRTIVRNVLNLFSFMQRYEGFYTEQNPTDPARSIFTGGVTMNTQWGSLRPEVRTAMLSAAESLNVSTEGVTDQTLLRAVFRTLANRLAASQSYTFVGVTI